MPWLLNEDAALKKKLQGLVVYDANSGTNGRSVPVRYRLPETEVGDLTYPIIVIQQDGWYPAPEREHRGYVQMPYAPEGYSPWWTDSGPATTTFQPSDSPYWSFFPYPYNLDYFVTVYCRFMHEHTIPLVSQLAQYDRLHPKFAFLDVPQDGTKRTMQLLSGPDLNPTRDGDGKRLFSVSYKVRVFSELVPQIVQYARATSINLDLSVYTDPSDISSSEITTSIGYLSTGADIAWNTEQLNGVS